MRGRPFRNRRAARTETNRPFVAIVGRPNVGKSTLFNRLCGERIAIVEDMPGVTRDRHYADAWILGRPVVLIDTGGFDPDSDDPMKEGIAGHIELALRECDVIVCVLDATVSALPADHKTVQMLRQANKPVIFVANKSESTTARHNSLSHYELGIDDLLPISALHNSGFGDLEERIVHALPPLSGDDEDVSDEVETIPKLALIGRPNAGKSSMLNRLVGEDRQLVDNRPGTTVDAVDTFVEIKGTPWILIDTAGIRRQRSIKSHGVESLSVIQAIRAIERAEVVVLMIDAALGAGEQDAKIAGLALERNRAIVIALNKVDQLSREDQKRVMDRTREILSFIPWAPMVTVSALEGTGVNAMMGRAKDAYDAFHIRVTTGELNRFFEQVLERHPPPTVNNRAVRLYYVTQVSTAPPTFVAVTNDPLGIHFSYQRYVVNQIRERFGFRGSSIRVVYREKKKRTLPPK